MTPGAPSGATGAKFRVRESGSTFGREAVGGLTTFLTMFYIAVVNPVILHDAGIPLDGAILATILASALATILMGLVVNIPVALAPGMGLNAFFAYSICDPGRDPPISWQAGLGVVALVAVVFFLLTIGRVRQVVTAAVPTTIRFASAVGIGIFISFIGLQHAGIVARNPATLVSLGDLRSPPVLLAAGGLAFTLVLAARKVPTAIFWGTLFTAAAGAAFGIIRIPPAAVGLPRGELPGLRMDLAGALRPDMAPLGIALLFFAVFDALGTLYAVGTEAGLVDREGRFPRLGRALTVDSLSALGGAALGTSSVTCYIESATGVGVGARTGLANIVTGLCFLALLFFMPLLEALAGGVAVGSRPFYPVTAPALILVGVFMARSVARIEWGDMTEAVPAFLTMVAMPLTFNISHGLAAGFVSYAGMKLAAGKGREVHPIVYIVAVLFAVRYLAITAGA